VVVTGDGSEGWRKEGNEESEGGKEGMLRGIKGETPLPANGVALNSGGGEKIIQGWEGQTQKKVEMVS
jgi:hypothetical protein